MSFAQSAFAQFLAGSAGRALRMIAGLALILGGLLLGGTVGIVLMVVGIIPLAAGTFDFCLITALFGGPFAGSEVRACRTSLR